MSLDCLVNDSDHSNSTLLDLLVDLAPLPEEMLLASNDPDALLAQDALAALPERLRQIVELRNGFTAGLGPMTLSEVAELVGFSRERVRQIESLAIAKCRQHLGLLPRGAGTDPLAKCRRQTRYIWRQHLAGVSTGEIAAGLGLTVERTACIIYKARVRIKQWTETQERSEAPQIAS